MLHLLLCLGLLVSGFAQAIAVAHSALAGQQARTAAAPCHEPGDRQEMAPHRFENHTASDRASAKPDCCKPGACDCACSHGSVATMPAVDAMGRGVEHAARLSAAPTRYASPALARLMRPPIV